MASAVHAPWLGICSPWGEGQVGTGEPDARTNCGPLHGQESSPGKERLEDVQAREGDQGGSPRSAWAVRRPPCSSRTSFYLTSTAVL